MVYFPVQPSGTVEFLIDNIGQNHSAEERFEGCHPSLVFSISSVSNVQHLFEELLMKYKCRGQIVTLFFCWAHGIQRNRDVFVFLCFQTWIYIRQTLYNSLYVTNKTFLK